MYIYIIIKKNQILVTTKPDKIKNKKYILYSVHFVSNYYYLKNVQKSLNRQFSYVARPLTDRVLMRPRIEHCQVTGPLTDRVILQPQVEYYCQTAAPFMFILQRPRIHSPLLDLQQHDFHRHYAKAFYHDVEIHLNLEADHDLRNRTQTYNFLQSHRMIL